MFSHQFLSHSVLSLSFFGHTLAETGCLQGGMALDGTKHSGQEELF